MSISKRLKTILEKHQLNRSTLAKKLGISHSVIINLVNDKGKLSNYLLLIFKDKLGINPEWLLKGTEPMYMPPNLEALEEKTAQLIKLFEELPAEQQAKISALAEEENKKHQELLREQAEYEKQHRADVREIMKSKRAPKYMVKIPIVGTIKAGIPSFSEPEFEDYVDYPDLTGEVYRNSRNYFYVRVLGNSMQECRMWDGDIVLVQKDDDEMTLKKIRFIDKTREVELIPCNPNFKTMTFSLNEVAIDGVIVGVDWRHKR